MTEDCEERGEPRPGPPRNDEVMEIMDKRESIACRERRR